MALLGSVVWLSGEWTWLHLMQSLEEWDSHSPKVSGGGYAMLLLQFTVEI